MSTLFTRILNGEIPGRFVWREPEVAAFLTTGPLADGHTLVVPTEEVDRWTDASPETLAKVMEVARRIGAVQVEVFDAARADAVDVALLQHRDRRQRIDRLFLGLGGRDRNRIQHLNVLHAGVLGGLRLRRGAARDQQRNARNPRQ